MKKYCLLILLLAFILRFCAAFYWEKRTQALFSPSEAVKMANGVAAKANVAEEANPNEEILKDSEFSSPHFFFGDSDSYWQLGRAIALGRPYQHDPQRCWKIFRMPGYPILLAPLFKFGGENPPVFWARLENIGFGLLTVFLTGALAYTLFRRRSVALLAMFGAAVHPELIFQSVLVLSEEAACAVQLLLLIVLTLWIRYLSQRRDENLTDQFKAEIKTANRLGGFSSLIWERSFSLAFLIGTLSSLAVYLRPDAFYFIPFILIFALIYFFIHRTKKQGFPFQEAALTFFMSFLIFSFWMSPWWIRNYRLTKEFTPTTLQMGASLYDGLSPTATGASNMDFVDKFRDIEINHPEGEPTEREFLEVRLDKRMKKKAVSWAKENPKRVLELAGIKAVRLWNFWPNEPSFSAPPIRLTVFLFSFPLFILAVVGFFLTVSRGFTPWLLWIPAVYVTCLHLIFVSSLRYRSPVLPGLMILAAYAVVRLFSRLKDQSF